MHQIKPQLRRQDLEGIHLPSFRFSWKLKKLCRVDFFVFDSWQTAEDVMVYLAISIGPEKRLIFGRFLTLFPLKRPARREKNTSSIRPVTPLGQIIVIDGWQVVVIKKVTFK
jgi:hypothetical protein